MAQRNSSAAAIPNDFSTLLGFGKLISLSGWCMVGLCVLLSPVTLFISLLGVPVGMCIVAFGQQTSCFVAIARNTHGTYEAVQRLTERLARIPDP